MICHDYTPPVKLCFLAYSHSPVGSLWCTQVKEPEIPLIVKNTVVYFYWISQRTSWAGYRLRLSCVRRFNSGQEVVADIWQGTSVSNKHAVARYQHSPQSPDNVKQKSIRQPTRGGRKGGAKNTKRVKVAELWGVVVEEGGFQNKTNHLTA